jgi:hypothetical protein
VRKCSLAIFGITAALAACGGGASNLSGPELFTYSAATQITSTNPMRFQTTVTVRNGTADAVEFEPGCPIPRVLIYSTAARSGTPVWDSNTRSNNCAALNTAPLTLQPGASLNFALTASGAEALGTSGAAGTYFVVGEVTLSSVVAKVNAGEVNLSR